MKTLRISVALAALVGVQLVTSAPGITVYRDETPGTSQVEAGMTWTGHVFPDDTERTTLTGDIKSIYDQILSLNPKFANDNSPVDPATYSTRGNGTGDNGPGVIDCNGNRDGSAVTWGMCRDTLQYLHAISFNGSTCAVPAKSCSTINCHEGCHVIVCNSFDNTFAPNCSDIADDMSRIHDACPVHEGVWPGLTGWFRGTIKWPHHETKVDYMYCDWEL